MNGVKNLLGDYVYIIVAILICGFIFGGFIFVVTKQDHQEVDFCRKCESKNGIVIKNTSKGIIKNLYCIKNECIIDIM